MCGDLLFVAFGCSSCADPLWLTWRCNPMLLTIITKPRVCDCVQAKKSKSFQSLQFGVLGSINGPSNNRQVGLVVMETDRQHGSGHAAGYMNHLDQISVW